MEGLPLLRRDGLTAEGDRFGMDLGSSSSLHEASACCRAAAADPAFSACPECAQRLLRCPGCGGALSALGHCATCVGLAVTLPQRVRLEAGGRCDVPLRIHSGSRPLMLTALRLRSGANEVSLNLGGAPCSPGQDWVGHAAMAFDHHGDFGLGVELELDWQGGSGLLHEAQIASVFVVRPRRDSAWIQGGTGNLINISGQASSWLAEQHATGPEGAQVAALQPKFRRAERDWGDQGRVVSWRTLLHVPDCLGWGSAIALHQSIGGGVLLGRDRPDSGTSQRWPHRAALRFPADMPHHSDSSRRLSREHLRFAAARGMWVVTQLGQSASVIVGSEGSSELRQGMSRPLLEGDRIFVVGWSGARMGLELRHRSVSHGHVRESELCRLLH